jgi:hypothetical protein
VERARAVEISGGVDPVLPASLRIGETTATLAAPGLAVSELSALGTCRRGSRGSGTRAPARSMGSGTSFSAAQADPARRGPERARATPATADAAPGARAPRSGRA